VEEELGVQEQWKKIQQAIKEATEETIQEQKPVRKENWFDEECAQVIARKNMARQKMLEKETRANTERYRELRREANRICNKKKKKEKMKRQLEEIQQLSKQNERRKFYKAVDKVKKGFQPKTTVKLRQGK
jgi:hypothetical protein